MLKTINCGKMPTRGTEFSACVDLYANADVIIGAGETVVIPLGVCIDIDYNAIFTEWNNYTYLMQEDTKTKFNSTHYLQLMLRSSLGKKGLILPNGVRVIDMDYADEICLIVHNPIPKFSQSFQGSISTSIYNKYKISKGDRIAQVMLCEHKSFLFGIESEVKRVGGMGSTGQK